MRSTMQTGPLLISGLLRHGQYVHGDSEVVTVEPAPPAERATPASDHPAPGTGLHAPTGPPSLAYRTASFSEVGERAEKLAAALHRIGVGADDRIGTFCWNNQVHLEAYLAIPSMGAILHTLNVRLFPEQLAYVVNHAEDKVVIVDASLVPLFARVAADLKTVKTVVVNSPPGATSTNAATNSSAASFGAGTTDTEPLAAHFDQILDYETLLAAEEAGYLWPALTETDAAAMCYTSGTTADPKGVVYSHRSMFLHSMAVTAAASIGMTEHDRLLAIVPMFHANAWGTPYAGYMVGTSLVMPQMFLQGAPLVRIIEETRPTLSCGVPTIWNDVLRVATDSDADLSSLRHVTAGGSAVPRALIEAFEERVGIPLTQGWGMTETSPLAALALPPAGALPHEEIDYRVKAGRVVPGVEVRVAGPEGEILPNDGTSVGEFEIRGPWVTAAYYKDPDPGRFHHGWLRTGDVGTLDRRGYMQITDRTKDVIKSGGEWISSVELENEVMAHPDVFEAAVVAVPDPKWQERPLVVVVPAEGRSPTAEELISYLEGKVARWWLPERWAFVKEIPKTSVGKFDKKVLRADHAAGQLDVVTIALPSEK